MARLHFICRKDGRENETFQAKGVTFQLERRIQKKILEKEGEPIWLWKVTDNFA